MSTTPLRCEAEHQKERVDDQMLAKPEPDDSTEDSDEEEETLEDEGWCQTLVISEKALEYYNKSEGEGYVMVLPWCSSGFLDRQGVTYHCNFWAKAGDETDDASASLFFAELCIVPYGQAEFYDAKLGGLRVVSCEKLDGASYPKYGSPTNQRLRHPNGATDCECDLW